jgi:hypothetical protein
MPAECVVESSVNDTVTQSAEVSGWNAEGQFFAEIAELDVADSGDITARLCHRIHSGSLVFVRLARANGQDAGDKGHPTAHEAYAIAEPDFTGRCRIRLTPCQPRPPRGFGDQTVPTRI